MHSLSALPSVVTCSRAGINDGKKAYPGGERHHLEEFITKSNGSVALRDATTPGTAMGWEGGRETWSLGGSGYLGGAAWPMQLLK